ncbi:VWA domain-containing protein [Acidovorax sp. NPDC077693]|uniref:VWA domain-containing protein n=1 Tax=unclassified Acidovorax TaxID=2684926 RepID=UPI0037C85758
MALTLDLNKSQQALVLNLAKAGVSDPPKVDVAFVMDVSGSFDDEHRQGVTNDLLTRLIPWAALFDPDQKMEVYTFSNGPRNVHHAVDVSARNYAGYVQREIIGCPGYQGGTDYSYVLERVLADFGWAPAAARPQGFFARLLGASAAAAPAVAPRQTLIFFVTDGESSDEAKTTALLKASQARGDGVYFHFLGVSNQSAKFPYIERLGEQFGNVGFTAVNQVRSWVKQPDDAINQALISDELVAWLKAGRA